MLTAGFKSELFNGSESSGFVEIVVAISGGLPTMPVNLLVKTIGQTADGEKYIEVFRVLSARWPNMDQN